MILRDYVFIISVIFTLCKSTVQIPRRSNQFKTVDTCECGRPNELAPRIVGGKETEPNYYPWMVAILNKGKIHCGGSLINDRYILTAGHCLKWSKKNDLSVILGLHDRVLIERERRGGVPAEIENIIVHEDFSSDYLHDTQDIGLIKLKHPVQFTAQIHPVCLPRAGSDFSKKRAMVTGWGRVSQAGDASKVLKNANVTVLTNSDCRTIRSIGEHILDSMLCAYEHGTDACQGDSGGPLVVEAPSGRAEQIGIVSWGIGCAKPGVPGVYTRTTSYLQWIASHTADAQYCKDPA